MSTVPTPPLLHGKFQFFSGLTVEGIGIFRNIGHGFSIGSRSKKQKDGALLLGNDAGPFTNWDVRQTAAIQNEWNGFVLDCPDFRRDPGVPAVMWPFNEGINQQWDFQLFKNIPYTDGAGQTRNLGAYWIRNRLNNLVLTVPGITQPGFAPKDGMPIILDLEIIPALASQIWIPYPLF